MVGGCDGNSDRWLAVVMGIVTDGGGGGGGCDDDSDRLWWL